MTPTTGDSRTTGLGTGRMRRVRRLLLQANDLEIDLEMTLGSTCDQARLAGWVAADRAEVDGGIVRLSTGTVQGTARLSVSGDF